MKVIGKTATGFLVEATEEELAKAAGYALHSAPWRNGGSGSSNDLKMGVVISVSRVFDYFERVRIAGDEVKRKSDSLRKLADLIDSGLPTTVITPKED